MLAQGHERRRRLNGVVLTALVGLSAAGLVFHSLLLADYTVDDAFISYRYARNLVEGHGLVYNQGERVEGYTNFLWCLLHALALRAGIEPTVCSKVLGIGAALATMLLILRWSLRWVGPTPWAAFGAMLWASMGAVAVTAVNGLETQLFTLLVAWGTVLASQEGVRSQAGGVVALAIAGLVRPEGMLALGLTVAFLLVAPRGRRAWLWVLLGAVLTLPHEAFRLSYYGSLVPNTLAAKTGGGLQQLVRGFNYVKGFVNEYGKPGLFLVAALPFLGQPLGRDRLLPLLVAGGLVAVAVGVGGDWIPHYRFLVPAFPLWCTAVGAGIWSLRQGVRRGWVGEAVICACGAAILVDVANQTHYLRGYTSMWAQGYRHAHSYVGRWLAQHASPSQTVALMDIGIIGYESRMKVVDITGLTDPHIASSSGGWLKKRYDLDYLFGLSPDYVVLVSATDYPSQPFGTSFPIDRAIFEDPRLLNGYTFLFSRDAYVARSPHVSGYYLLVFRKRE